ncbi:MAG: hypothetical protein J4F41_09885 [Alphaproteobacteria bacterium]|nr:hypothetical protein [Alphaproteobacteria bacterium]
MTPVPPIANNRRNFIIKAAAATVMASPLLVACAGPAQRIVEHHYGMSLELAALPLPEGKVVTLDRVTGQGIFAGRPIVEMINDAPAQYVETRSKLWHSSPADLLRDAAIKGWNASSGRMVAASASTSRAELKLDLDLIGIGFDMNGAGFINLRATLSTSDRKVLINGHYDATGPSAGDLNSSVLSIEKAAENALNALAADIAAAI